MFEPLETQSVDERERRILDFWRSERIFQRSVDAVDGDCEGRKRPPFVFFDGPPFATGLPHYGHLLGGIIKDVIPRYKTMRGYRVVRRFGWDCHGLPVETQAEAQCHLSGAEEIEAFGIGRFNEVCEAIVRRHDQKWEEISTRLGRWVDFASAWQTMDANYMESVWWVFKQLFDRDLIYLDFKVLPFSWKLGTPLSNFEASENYQEVEDPSLIVKFPLKGEAGTSFLAWTTTPWTLLANMALVVGEDLEYVKVREKASGEKYVLSQRALATFFRDRPHEIVARLVAKDLEGYAYEPLFDHFADRSSQGAFRIISDPFVSFDEGTGIVHAAPAFGESDFYACRKHGIPLVCPVGENGHLTDGVDPFSGLHFSAANDPISAALQERKLLFSRSVIRHRYPMCWRTDTPLIYRATKTWFVAVEALKEAMLKHNQSINWVPEHIGQGRFGKWLEHARDWAISRNRYWGTPIPIWRGDRGGVFAVESRAQLRELTGVPVEDLHRHHVDQLTFEIEGETYRRIHEVFDCWFESGAMPYAHRHYPFEGCAAFDASFPADFIAEGLDQTRGWFYTLHVLAAALFDRPAFKNAIVNGIVLAEDGAKMSKRLKNYPDPEDLLTRYGADATRLYMLQSGAVRGENLQFSAVGVEHCLRSALIPWWNAYAFLATYARIYHWRPAETIDVRALSGDLPEHILDRWILSRSGGLIDSAVEALENYQIGDIVTPLIRFIDELTNWYIRRSRRRFWQDDDNEDRRQAFATLYRALWIACHLAAPITPFVAEDLYQRLKGPTSPQSVHLSSYPERGKPWIDRDLDMGMKALMGAAAIGHSLRKEQKLRVRQPLASAKILCGCEKTAAFLREHGAILEDELNVKSLAVSRGDGATRLSGKPNFRALGKKWGELLPQVQGEIEKLDQTALQSLEAGNPVELHLQGRAEPITLLPEEVAIRREIERKPQTAAAGDGDLVVILDIALTPELLEEGLVRELVNKINSMRRDRQLAVEDRIELQIEGSRRICELFGKHADYIGSETLVERWSIGITPGRESTEWTLEGTACAMAISRVDR